MIPRKREDISIGMLVCDWYVWNEKESRPMTLVEFCDAAGLDFDQPTAILKRKHSKYCGIVIPFPKGEPHPWLGTVVVRTISGKVEYKHWSSLCIIAKAKQ